MYKVKLMNKISSVGLDYFNEDYEYGETLENEDAILLRSASLHEYEFTKNVKAIARAGAGVNNIPVEKCSEKGIVVFKQKVLLMKRVRPSSDGLGYWELPGGGLEYGETPNEALKRELKEETGLNADKMKEITRVVHDGHHSLYIIYLCVSDFDKNSVVLQEGETIDYKWVDKETFEKIDENELAARRTLEAIREYNL